MKKIFFALALFPCISSPAFALETQEQILEECYVLPAYVPNLLTWSDGSRYKAEYNYRIVQKVALSYFDAYGRLSHEKEIQRKLNKSEVFYSQQYQKDDAVPELAQLAQQFIQLHEPLKCE